MPDIVSTITALTGPRPRVIVAFSGGLDSTVLAHLLVKQRRKLGNLRLAHVDHGLQAASGEWSRHCARLARQWRIPIVLLEASIARGKESPEAAAREARYALLAKASEPGEVLVTAQHRDDQAETLLLQLLRGAGVTGLAAMPAFAPFARGFIARPLLDMPRTQIEAIARRAQLRWIEDPSNDDTRFSRNYLRHRLMPLIREHWPGADKALVRSAALMAEAAALLNERAAQDLARLADGDGLSVRALRALPMARRRNALRAFIARHGVEMPEASRLREMSGPLLEARVDAQPEVAWSATRIVRRSGRLELQSSRKPPRKFVAKSWRWRDDRRLILEDGALDLQDDAEGPIDLALLPEVLELRARSGGERLRPSARARTATLKSLLQNAKVPVDERASLPLLFAGDRLIAVGARWVDASIAANVKSRRRARLQWEKETGSDPI
ncbi:MAG TPA: tRNA lysidine(34) synthetase TilS [Steroidobacteraceae bacterium]|nr:tRNA lysidine(34) synthetase TilS [Steroidobacteraceae bacterium]